MRRFEGRTVVISGGARGLGASHRPSHGARVVVGDLLEEEGADLVAELGESARFVHLDVTDENSWASAVGFARSEFGSLDVLANNAGIIRQLGWKPRRLLIFGCNWKSTSPGHSSA